MSLKIDLGKVRRAKGNSFNYELVEEKIAFSDLEIKLIEPLRILVNVTNTGSSLKMTGSIQTKIQASCSRCLEDISIPVNNELVEELIYIGDIETLGDLTQEEVEEKYYIYDNDKFDLTHIVRENILLSLPSKILCDENCRGLCSKCGKNLNIEECNCTTEEIDPRLAILAKLKGTEEV